MGKRKRELEGFEEEPASMKKIKTELENGYSSDELQAEMQEYIYDDRYDNLDSSDLMPKKNEKRKSVTWDKSVIPPSSDSEPPQFTNGSPKNGKIERRRTDVEQNDEDEWIHYLMRKPAELTLEDLEDVSMPSNQSDWKKIKLKTKTASYTLKPIKTPAPLVWFPSMTIITNKDSQKIRSGGQIKAQAVIMPVDKEIPGGPIFDAGDDIPEDLEPSYKIRSIRRLPKLDLKNKQQRLFAFGVK